MKINLNVPERLTAMQLLPKEGNFVQLKMVRDLTAKLGLSADELEEFGIEQTENNVIWNDKGKEERPIEFKDREVSLIMESLEKLNKDEKLEQRHFSLYEKFMEEK